MTNPSIFNQLLVWPIVNVLIVLYRTFELLKIPGALGLAVIAMTVIIRLILYPLSLAQLKSAQKLNKVKPELDRLNKLHKEDKVRLQQEQMRLYKEAGINPAAGCLPLLLQFPILIALYNVFFQLLGTTDTSKVIETINKVIYPFLLPFAKVNVLDLSFFGLNLAAKPSEWQTKGIILLTVPLITGLLQYWQTKIMLPKNQESRIKNQEIAAKNNILKKEGNKEDKKEEDMGTMMQKQMGIMMPLMIGFFAYSFPLGLSLYWNTFSIFGIIQQYQINKETEKENAK